MGAPEVLGEQVSTPFAGHDLPGVLREQLHGLSDPSDPRIYSLLPQGSSSECTQVQSVDNPLNPPQAKHAAFENATRGAWIR